MQEFVKNILSYYAAFTETRFSNRSTLSYKWTNDINLTLDISFFPAFRGHLFEKLSADDRMPIDIRPLQYKIEISSQKFKERLDELFSASYDLDLLRDFISKSPRIYPGMDRISGLPHSTVGFRSGRFLQYGLILPSQPFLKYRFLPGQNFPFRPRLKN